MPYSLGLDTETNVTDDITLRKCYVVQLGNYGQQIVIDWLRAPQWAKDWARGICEDESKVKIIHNAAFDLGVLWNEGIKCTNIHDTMVSHQVLRNGLTVKDASLAELVELYLFKFVDKRLQTSYNGNELTEEQIRYAALDVKYLGIIRRAQILESNEFHLQTAMGFENSVAEALARMEYDGVRMEPERWKEARIWAENEFYAAIERLKETIENDPRLLEHAIATGGIIHEDTVNINWNSPPQKKLIAEHFFAPHTGLSKPVLKTMVRQATEANEPYFADMFLDAYNGNYASMQEYIMKEDRQWLIDRELLFPAGMCRINWNSNPQMHAFGRIIAPHLKSMEAKHISKRDHPFFGALVKYGEWQKRIGTYGEDFMRHIKSDGRIHTRYHNLVDTGRVSSSNPNLQNIPAKGIVKDRYRRAFVPEPGNLMHKADYTGQEIVLAATIYREPVWLNALKAGHDIHSVVAEMLFERDWKNGAEADCAYYKDDKKLKCNCRIHKEMRDKIKTFNFGLLYGMTEAGLSERMGISRQEALGFKQEYFRKLISLKKWMDMYISFAVHKGYIRGPGPVYRVRWFPDWPHVKHEAQAYLRGISTDYRLAEIAKQAVNTPVQGGGADVVKAAMWLLYEYLRTHDILGIVKLALNVHDEIVTEAPAEMTEWPHIQAKLMKHAADLVVPSGLLDCELKTTLQWEK